VLDADGVQLVHYHRDQSRPDRPWVRGAIVAEDAAGPGAIAHLPERPGGAGALHVLVPMGSRDHGAAGTTAHVVRSQAPGEPRRWRRLGCLPGVSPVLALHRGRLVAGLTQDGVRERWEWDGAVWAPAPGAPPEAPAPAQFAGALLGPDPVALALARTHLAGTPLVGDALAALPGGDRGLLLPLGPPGAGWLQALAQEGRSVYQWHRQEWRGRVRWVRAACLRFDPGDGFVVDAASSAKLAQITGEVDSQPSRSDATLSASESRSGVRGTDLGVRFEHAGRSFLLFGDTHWTRPLRATRDALGELTDAGPVPGLPGVELHGSPLAIVGGAATCREYDVPLDAVSLDGELIAFFSSHHFARHQVMGRSLITRAVDPSLPVDAGARRHPLRFAKLATFSDRFFVNVSLQRRGDVLYLWGSGSYRADDLRLAAFDLASPPLRAALAGHRPWSRPQPGVSYWAGQHPDNTPRWSPHEDAAAPVLPGAFGELSVRYVAAVGRYLLLAMSGPEDPLGPGVTLRAASAPWGPWTPRRRLFDWVADGMAHDDEASRFLRAHRTNDPVGDAIFHPQRQMTGAAYAPYLFEARLDGDDLVLRYTLSTWNPYQVVLMEHRLAAASVR